MLIQRQNNTDLGSWSQIISSLPLRGEVGSVSIPQLRNLEVRMRSQHMNRVHRHRGFSLIELMIVLVISLVVSALALPNIAAAITNIRLRGAASNVAGLLQECRILAVKTNRVQVTRMNGTGAFVDVAYSGTYAATYTLNGVTAVEPGVQIPTSVVVATNPPTAFPSNQLLGYVQFPLPSAMPFNIGFNQRGLPCGPNSSAGTPTACPTLSFLYYFKIAGAFGDSWAALTITPAGRIHVWTLNGTTWS